MAIALIVHWLIIAIVLAGIIGITLVVLRQAGIAIPGFILTILWIILAVVLGVFAVKFLGSQI